MDSDTRRALFVAAHDQYRAEVMATAEIPPPEVLARPINAADVKRYPDYFIVGDGRTVAESTECRHGYHLTDSCPGCDADEENGCLGTMDAEVAR